MNKSILIKKELRVNINENNIIQIINKNINQIGNYFKLIIENIYSLDYHLENKKYKFPLNNINTDKNNNSKEISSFFFEAFIFTDTYSIHDFNKF